jgi:hypothetical protein
VNTIIFGGPTLCATEIRAILPDAVVLPPVSQGDVYRAGLRRPDAIGIIDGYFERVPSVWHKEILWAMSEGIHVFGAASMGALRAAELEAFGMIGVGVIFEQYRGGVLEDDDEVAVSHATEEHGYRATSDAMVNIRATLPRAAAESVIGENSAAELEARAKLMFYPCRHYADLLAGLPENESGALREWLPRGRVDVKRLDALAMLETMRDFLGSNPGPKLVSFVLEETVYFQRLKRSSAEVSLLDESDSLVLAEARRDAAVLERARYAALAIHLARQRAGRERRGAPTIDLAPSMEEFLRRHDGSGMAQWMEQHRCTADDFYRIIENDALARWAEKISGTEFELSLLDYLRWSGDYRMLLDRARNSSSQNCPG